MNNKITYLILGIVVLGALGVSVWALQKSNVTQTVPEEPIVNQKKQEPALQTYQYEGFKIKYPSGWSVQENYYRTPAQQDRGEPASIVGIDLVPANKQAKNDTISLGGRQIDCNILGDNYKCVNVSYLPIYTSSKNPEVLEVFDLVIKNIVH